VDAGSNAWDQVRSRSPAIFSRYRLIKLCMFAKLSALVRHTHFCALYGANFLAYGRVVAILQLSHAI
jgi:drug/metabolite transporter superfamily protein YnfA